MRRANNLQRDQDAVPSAASPAEIVRMDAALLAITHFFGSREVRGAVEQSGVPPSHRNHFIALRAIRDLPQPVSIKDVQGEIGLSHPATCRAIDRCVVEGLVDRRPSEQDRRHMILVLTEMGEAAAQSVEAARQDIVATLIEGWNDGERRALLDWLERLTPELALFRARRTGLKTSD
ncbi:MarR family winged helix-turn-helix transcriptional regulator [Sphingobium sp.]|uniref:MarR family winged helix-turn-helix transcriptional regulator n=1 Tax=Sphingobium sp. TaxID=1912891 RepID=UPI002CA52D22|nr:MarR family winged helix-turn-helix transcriptional regulator [Sphingobium sp.]HUD90645.1 MarR family winged helix-turn-helix transcriptional regulator [Sphingobium sp.]